MSYVSRDTSGSCCVQTIKWIINNLEAILNNDLIAMFRYRLHIYDIKTDIRITCERRNNKLVLCLTTYNCTEPYMVCVTVYNADDTIHKIYECEIDSYTCKLQISNKQKNKLTCGFEFIKFKKK